MVLAVELKPITAFVASAAVLLIYLLCLAIYRLYFSPIAGFPGPKIAALTRWYETYYDVFASGGGMYMWEVEKMHQKYGPVVRINPDELHFADFEFYNTIYASAPAKRDRYAYHAKAPDAHYSTGFTIDHETHKKRREAMAPFFSKRNVQIIEPEIHGRVDRICEVLEEHCNSKSPINLTNVSLGLTIDTLSNAFFADGFETLQQPLTDKWRDDFLSVMRALHVTRHFYWISVMMKVLPDAAVKLLAPDFSGVIELKNESPNSPCLFRKHANNSQSIQAEIQDMLSYKGKYSPDVKRSKRTVGEELRDSDKIPLVEKSLARLTDESYVGLIAGSESPGKIISLILYHLMKSPEILKRLRAELRPLISSPTGYSCGQLQELPYLSGVVCEGLRLHGGVIWRSQRISREPLQYKNWMIPAGTPMSSAAYFTHYNEEFFPNPRRFIPERWLESKGSGAEGESLKRYLISSGRGTRSCIGYNLGNAMVYMMVAAVAAKFDMVPFETDDRDVDLERDWSIPQPRPDSKGVRATVVRKVVL